MKVQTQAFPTPAIWYAHRVSYGETDTMGYVYYAEYLHIFERARSAFFRTVGMSYNEVEKKGFLLPVREASCRYRKPARYDDLLWCHTAISEITRASMTFQYEILTENRDTLLMSGMTQHALTDRSGKPVRLPDWLKASVDLVPDDTEVLV